MPRNPGSVTKRKAAANAHSLNETKQPTRQGETAEERRAELAAIIEWLAVDDESHQRYQPTPGTTFCSVYVHEYCHLAGCHVPRFWWSPAAIEAHAQGQAVLPRLGSTIDERGRMTFFTGCETSAAGSDGGGPERRPSCKRRSTRGPSA